MGTKFIPMNDLTPSLSGYRGTRAELLLALKKEQPLTARELAERFGLTPNALRRHLEALETDGVVRHRREVRGVGGPVYEYSLTEGGEALFPRAYGPALTTALEALSDRHGVDSVVTLFRRQWDAVAEEAKPRLSQLPLAGRAQVIAELLSAQGYMAESESVSEGVATLREHNCAIRAVAERFPEVCAAEARFLADVLGAVVERHGRIVEGCNACEYSIQLERVSRSGSSDT
jgi:DeoR family transcriptional regulator, suf operon transcriptional repressor